ncbi:MAG TPA: TolC family outer membrane protein [Steroidobacteraceae bacterium]|jgi:outer membrane protein|nr:TolC family outer membrane protein [Steroidobacteraceae bacterium]
MVRISLLTAVLVSLAQAAHANDLKQFYELALTRDTTLQAAHFQRDALVEARPQALAQWLPQIAANASATRERAGFDSGPALGNEAADCAISSTATTQRCYGTVHSLGLNMSQTLWSFQAFSQLKESNFQVAAAESSYQGAQQSLLLRVAQAYFGILSAADQLSTNIAEREAFNTLLNQAKSRQQTGVGPRSDVDQAQAFYDATEQSVIDARNALDDANLALTEIVGQPVQGVAPLREDIPLLAPEPASADDWVASARQDNFDVRTAELNMEAASRDISVQRGRGLPTISLTGSGSKLTQDAVLGGNQTLDTIGVSFSWPLFQGGAIASAVRQSRALFRQSQANYQSIQRDTERQTRAAFRGIVSGIQRIGAARRAVESGERAVEAMRRNVEFGTGTEFELLDAQNNYYTARRAYSQARYDYLTNVLTLKQQAGRLSEMDLVAIDNLLIEKPA